MKVNGPDNKAYNFPDDVTDSEILSFFGGEPTPTGIVDKVKVFGQKLAHSAPVESAAAVGKLVTSPVTMIGSGYKALAAGAGNVAAGGNFDSALQAANESLQADSEAAWQPITEAGKTTEKIGAYPFEKLAQGAEFLTNEAINTEDYPDVGAVSSTLLNAAPFAAPFIAKGMKTPKVAESKPLATPSPVPKNPAEVKFESPVAEPAAPAIPRPAHDNLAEGIPAAASAELQGKAPEVKPVVKGTTEEIASIAVDASKEVFDAGNGTSYIIDKGEAVKKYGGTPDEAVLKAANDLVKGGDTESALLGYPKREGLTPRDTIDAAVTKEGAVVTDLPTMKAEKDAGNIAWAAEGKPGEVTAKAGEVSTAIKENVNAEKATEGRQNAEGYANERYADEGRQEGLLNGEAPQKLGGETTSIKNAVVDAERAADGLPPIETPVGGRKAIETSLDEGKRMVESGEFSPATVDSIIKNPRTVSDSENMALLYMKQRNRLAHDSVTDRIIEAKRSGTMAEVEALKAEREAIELDRLAIDKAGKAAGTEWGRAGRARQEMMAEDYSLQRNIQRARSESPSGEISEAQRVQIENLTARLETVMKEAATKEERIANLEAEIALKRIQREEGLARRKGERKANVEVLDQEFEALKRELNGILNPNQLNAGLDPAVIPVIVKMARNRIQKGTVKAADIVDDIYNALEGKTEKREIAKAIASYQPPKPGKKESVVKKDYVDRQLKSKEEALKRQIDAVVSPMTAGKRARAVFTEAWKAGLLSGPKTHIVNIASNALTVWLKPTESLLASAAETVRTKATGQPREVFAGEAMADVVGMRAGIDEGFRRAARGWAEALPPEEMLKHNESQQMYAIPGRTGKVVRIPFRALSAADGFFKAIAESSEVYRLAYKQAAMEGLKGDALKNRMAEIIQNPDAKILDKAVKEADYRTFNSEFGPFGKWVASSRRIPYVGVLADILMPFVRTPINIAKYGLERTPLNYGRLLYKALKKETRGAALSEELAKPMFGTMIAAAVVNGVISGNITGGGPKDKADKEALYRTGWQPYSIKIGDKYFSYNRFEPIGMVFGTTADFADLAFGNEANVKTAGDAANAVALSIAKNWTSKTFMQSLSAALDATSDPKQYGGRFIQNYAGSLIPAIVNTGTALVDEYRRDVRDMPSAMMARVPGASEQLEVKRDLWGRPIKKAGLTPIDRALSPVVISQESNDPVDKEVLRLGISPGMPKRKIKGNDLTDEQYSRYVDEAGQRAYKIVQRIVASNDPDEAKSRRIKAAIEEQREIAGMKLLREWNMKPVRQGATK